MIHQLLLTKFSLILYNSMSISLVNNVLRLYRVIS